jgi:hypothetical protein
MSPITFMARRTMRSFGNALVWIGLTVGLPGVLYAMTMVPTGEEPEARSQAHHPENCAVCRHYRGVKVMPVKFSDDNMILVSPGHPIVVADSASGAE